VRASALDEPCPAADRRGTQLEPRRMAWPTTTSQHGIAGPEIRDYPGDL